MRIGTVTKIFIDGWLEGQESAPAGFPPNVSSGGQVLAGTSPCVYVQPPWINPFVGALDELAISSK